MTQSKPKQKRWTYHFRPVGRTMIGEKYAPNGGVTVILIEQDGVIVRASWSACSTKENFSRKRGFKIANGRLEKNRNNRLETAIINAYLRDERPSSENRILVAQAIVRFIADIHVYQDRPIITTELHSSFYNDVSTAMMEMYLAHVDPSRKGEGGNSDVSLRRIKFDGVTDSFILSSVE